MVDKYVGMKKKVGEKIEKELEKSKSISRSKKKLKKIKECKMINILKGICKEKDLRKWIRRQPLIKICWSDYKMKSSNKVKKESYKK